MMEYLTSTLGIVLILLFGTALGKESDFSQHSWIRKNEQGENLSELERKWHISKPIFDYHGYSFDLDYTIGDYIDYDSVSYKVFDSHECSAGGDEVPSDNDYLVSVLETYPKEPGNDTSYREMKIKITIQIDKIRNSPIYEDFGTFSHVYFCVRVSAFHEEGGLDKMVEVNWVESPVLLVMDDFSVSTGSFRSAFGALEEDAVEAYICDSDSNLVQSPSTEAGQYARVCVVPLDTMLDGGYVGYLEDFAFKRDETTQVAIQPGSGGSPASLSTKVSCEPGSAVCSFETFLEPEFFKSIGIIKGTGTAFLHFVAAEETLDVALPGELASGNETLSVRTAPTVFTFQVVALKAEGGDESSSGELSMTFLAIFAMLTTSYFS